MVPPPSKPRKCELAPLDVVTRNVVFVRGGVLNFFVPSPPSFSSPHASHPFGLFFFFYTANFVAFVARRRRALSHRYRTTPSTTRRMRFTAAAADSAVSPRPRSVFFLSPPHSLCFLIPVPVVCVPYTYVNAILAE